MITLWNPRYVSYAREHGKTAEQMLESDAEAYPGGEMTGFMLWIGARWSEWDRSRGHGRDHVRTNEEHVEFTAWLESGR